MPSSDPPDRPPPLPPLPLGTPAHLDEAQAALVWERAAQLQAEALDREQSGYRTADVAGAAEEAGIARQYVEMALAELPRDVAFGPSSALGTPDAFGASALDVRRVSEPTATRYLGTDRRSIAVSLEVPASPERTLRALTMLQQPPYELRLNATVGPHPLDGGTLVFDLPGVIVNVSAPASAVNLYWMATHYQLEARQVQLTLRALDERRTLVTMTADLLPGVRRNVLASRWIAGTFGGGAGLTAGFMLAQGAATVASAAVLAPALAIAAAVAGLSVLGYRRLYPNAVRTAESEMRRALDAVASAVRAEAVFGGPRADGRP